jgi:hypothetical protein
MDESLEPGPATPLLAYVHRRVAPHQWDPKTNQAQPAAFRRRPNEAGLSVYRADLATPRRTLELMLAAQRAKARSSDPLIVDRATLWLQKNGDTPELLVDNGWRVVRLSLDAFTAHGFQIGTANADGHLDIRGSIEAFERYSLHFARVAQVLSPQECLR